MQNSLFSLNDRTVLVTGASSGIGAHLAETACQAGARVVIGARRLERLDELAARLREQGGDVLAVPMDVSCRESVESAFDQAQASFGVVDVLINNAGVGLEKRFMETNEEDWRTLFDTNLDGVWRVAQCTAQRLAKVERPGSIINIASILGLRVSQKLSAYCASKAAVAQLTRAMALELARYRIRVNAIAPGYYHTEINDALFTTQAGLDYIQQKVPMRRLGQLHELDGPMLLLASAAGSFMTGEVLAVDGGQLVNSL